METEPIFMSQYFRSEPEEALLACAAIEHHNDDRIKQKNDKLNLLY